MKTWDLELNKIEKKFTPLVKRPIQFLPEIYLSISFEIIILSMLVHYISNKLQMI